MTLRQWAARIADAVDPDMRAHLADNPLAAMTRAGLRIGRLEQSSENGRFCDGLSTASGVVLYIASPGSRRENFTLLHEFAHSLIDADTDVLGWLADQPDVARVTEQLCDEVAALLLVPAQLMDQVVGAGPIRAEHLQRLHRETAASQEAIAVALARRLTTTGAVVLVNRVNQTVAAAILVGELAVFPWRGQPVPTGHPLHRITPGITIHHRSWWETPWAQRQSYYLDATASDRRAYAILATTDLWEMETFHADLIPEPEARPTSTRACPCGYSGRMQGYPCQTCDQNYCPKCGKCRCDYRDSVAVRCRGCTVSYASTVLIDGLCSECR